jgi:hypothetical protein
MTTVGPAVVVRLPGRRCNEDTLSSFLSPFSSSDVEEERQDLLLFSSPSGLSPSSSPDTEEIDDKWSYSRLLAANPIQEALLVKAAWSERLSNRKGDAVYNKENEPNDEIRQATPQTTEGGFDSDHDGVISLRLS